MQKKNNKINQAVKIRLQFIQLLVKALARNKFKEPTKRELLKYRGQHGAWYKKRGRALRQPESHSV